MTLVCNLVPLSKVLLTRASALGGTLSSYTWICMILNFLQTRSPPILPSLHNKPHQRKADVNGIIPPFDDDAEKYRGYGRHNKESISELLFNFFRRYAHDLDYERDVISVREGRLLSKEAKRWHLMQNNRLCVEEPFNTERNLGNTADDISFRGIHLELRRAFDLISEARLEDCLHQYDFPATEEKIWERPTPKPVTVLRSRSQSQSSRVNRGGHVQRGGRQGTYKTNNRRASSATATNTYPLAPSEGQSGRSREREYLSREEAQYYSQQQAMALHAHLMNKMQVLAVHEQELRYIQAQTQQAQLQEANERITKQQPNSREHRTSSAGLIPYSAPLRSAQFTQPWVYPQVPGTPSIHTQPSSPSLRSAQPALRRGLHRSTTQENLSRSHSQPARSIPLGSTVQSGPLLPLSAQSFLLYQQQMRQQQQLYEALEAGQDPRQMRPDPVLYYDPRRLPTEFGFEDNIPKEYVGYWVNEPPSTQGGRDGVPSQVPIYQDLPSRVRGTPQQYPDGRRKNSRSPSPSSALPSRVRSYSVRSASSAPLGPGQYDPMQTHVQGLRNGSVVISGAHPWAMPEYQPAADGSSHPNISETNSGSDEQQYETPIGGDLDAPPNGAYYVDDPLLHHGYQYFHPLQNGTLQQTPAYARNGVPESAQQQALSGDCERPSSQMEPDKTDPPHKAAGGLGIQFGAVESNDSPSGIDQSPPQKHDRQTDTMEHGPVTPVSGIFEKPAISMPLLSPVREVRTPSPIGQRMELPRTEGVRSFRPIHGKMDLRIPSFAELVRMKQGRNDAGTVAQRSNSASTTTNPESFNTDRPSTLSKSSPTPEPAATKRVSPNLTSNGHFPPIQVKKDSGPANGQVSNGQSSHSSPPPIVSRSQATPELTKSTAQPAHTSGWQQQTTKKSKKNSRSRPGSGNYPKEPLPVNEAERKGG